MADSRQIFPEALPGAWLGYAEHPKKFCVVRICAWHHDKAAADKLAKDAGLEITHTICRECSQKLQAHIIPDSL